MSSTAPWIVARRVVATAAVVLAALAAAPLARAQEVHSIEPGSDSVTGSGSGADAPRLLPIRLFEGAPLSIEVKADKGSAFHPVVVLRGIDRKVDADAAFVVDAKGVKASLKNYIPKATGLHWIEVSGADEGTGSWTMKTKVKLPKGVAGAGELEAGSTPTEFVFACPGGAIANITVAGAPKESGAPTFNSLKTTTGAAVFAGELKPGKAGFSLKGAQLGPQGRYALSINPGIGGSGTFKVKISWKLTVPPKRILPAANIVADPVLIGLDPTAGTNIQVLSMHLGVDFAQPGAAVEFRFGAVVISVPAASITLVPGEAQFSLNLASFANGTYDVVLTNPDGGTDSLDDVLTVTTVAPVPTSVEPNFSYENRVARVKVFGSFIQGNATVAMKRGAATIPGSPIGFGANFIEADFNLNGAARGLWDVVVTNPGAVPATLPNAFEVLQIITLDSMTPPDNKDGLVVNAVILGGGFVNGAQARLERLVDGSPVKIQGTGLALASGAEMHVAFDTTDAVPGLWNLVLDFPLGEVRTLTNVFRVRIVGGGGDAAQPFSASQTADGPPALAYNDATGEYLVAWVEEDPSGIVLAWHLFAQMLDGGGNPVGKPVEVSDDGGTMEKKYATAGYDPVHDEYLVCWTEKATINPQQVKKYPHPSGSSAIQLSQVLLQRLSPKDLSKIQKNVPATDSTTFTKTATATSNWRLSDFNSYRPAIAFDAKAGVWEIAWMEEFDTTGLYYNDDFDVFQRSFNPASPAFGVLAIPAGTDAHEGDPALCYDPGSAQVFLSYSARASVKGGDRDLYLGYKGNYAMILPGKGDDLADSRLAVDAVNNEIVVTWTRAVSDGTRAVEAAAVGLWAPGSINGSYKTMSSGGIDLYAIPVANKELGVVSLFWTRNGGKGKFAAMRRDADLSSGNDLVFAGDESEVSSGSGDEGLITAVYASGSGETTVVWLATLTETGNKTYLGDVLPNGPMRGVDFWFQRLK